MVKKKLHVSESLSNLLTLPRILTKILGFNDLKHFLETLKEDESLSYDEFESNYLIKILNRFKPNEIIESEEKLREYDLNIKTHFERIANKRHINLKFYQYAAVFLTELYLDLYFKYKQESKLSELVNLLNKYRNQLDKEILDNTEEYKEDDLHKLCFWMATGSGKTIIMHINILQFDYYSKKYGSSYNSIYLITPNESLTEQHLREFKKSGIEAIKLTKRNYRVITSNNLVVKIIEIHKIKDEFGDKTISYEAFGRNNLILVDEGHKGTVSGKSWIKYRNEIAKEGFTLEYSATFTDVLNKRQVKVSNKNVDVSDYKKTIIMDYSYKFFHRDGYGKDYFIINASKDTKSELLMMASLLEFFQQKLVYNTFKSDAKILNFYDPLMLLVGSTVLGKNNRDANQLKSDIIKFIKFIAKMRDPNYATLLIKRILEKDEIVDQLTNQNVIYKNLFYLREKYNKDYKSLLNDLYYFVFHTQSNDAKLRLINIKNSDGEIGLRFSDSKDYFGLIYVGKGNDAKLLKDEQLKDFVGESEQIQGSLFESLHKERDKPINILIGAKKFIEGWDNYRVSTMLLMNFGKSKSISAIQLFGRGVRLKGYKNTLKRYEYLDDKNNIEFNNYEFVDNNYYRILETLNVYGINANYIEQFRKEIEEDVEFYFTRKIEVKKNSKLINSLGNTELLIIEENKERVSEFKKRPIDFMKHNGKKPIITIDLRQKISTLKTKKSNETMNKIKPNLIPHEKIVNPEFLSLVDWNKIIREVREYLLKKGYFNLNLLDYENLKTILEESSNFKFYGDEAIFDISSYSQDKHINLSDVIKIIKWNLEQTYIYALKKFFDKVYSIERKNFRPLYDLKPLNLEEIKIVREGYYEMKIKQNFREKSSKDEIIKIIEELQKIKSEELIDLDEITSQYKELIEIKFEHHLYTPLLIKDENYSIYELNPDGLNEGEIYFVRRLKEYLNNNEIKGKVILLRNNVGDIGFQLGEIRFYPDFIMWFIKDNMQKIVFLDPKGLGRHIDLNKLNLHNKIKEIEEIVKKDFTYKNQEFELYYFTLSTTKKNEIGDRRIVNDPLSYGVIFLYEESPNPIDVLFNQIDENFKNTL